MDCANHFTVVAGNLLLTSAEVDPGVKSDIVESLLFSQLYADEEIRKPTTRISWFSCHDRALKNCKWTVVDHEAHSFEPDDDVSITLASRVESSLLPQLQKEQADCIRALMEHSALFPEDDPALSLFHRRVVTPDAGSKGKLSTVSLQVSALSKEWILSSLWVSFSTREVVGGDLFGQAFQSNSIDASIDVRFSRREWSEAGYATVSAKVREFLAPRKQGLVLPLSCAAQV